MMPDVANKARPFLRKTILSTGLAGSLICAILPGSAFALTGSEVAPAQVPAAPSTGLPLPDPMRTPSTSDSTATEPASASGSEQGETPKIEILQDLSQLPEAVRKTRQALVEAAASGDVERLRPLMAFDDDVMQQLEADGGNPVESFKSLSGDPDGLEILAIMLDILQTGAARVGIGTPDEMYVWPYFVGKPLAGLSAPERVELLRIITAGDLATMQETNNYNFYRIGIATDGRWRLFAGGD